MLFPAYDGQSREPIFFSKYAYSNFADDKPIFKANFSDVVWASSINYNLFTKADVSYTEKNGTVDSMSFLGGSPVASCPAMYASYLANKFWKIPYNKMNVVVIGNKEKSSDKINSIVSVLSWANKLLTLTGPVKRQTQNYMMEHLLRSNNRNWWYFNLPTE